MVKTRPFNFIWARSAEDLEPGLQRTFYWIWNGAALLASSALIAVMSLLLAYGVPSEVDGSVLFLNYFRHFSLFLLNWLPVFLLQLLLYAAFGRQWAAYLFSSLLFVAASLGNFYKLKFRFEPVLFSDLKLLGAALDVVSGYDLAPGGRVLAAVLAVPLGSLLLALLVRGRPSRKGRLAASLAVLLSLFPLWSFVYSSDRLYKDTSVLPEGVHNIWDQQVYMAKGFVYPFIHSVKASFAKPDGYSEEKAAALLSAYTDQAIPEDRQVNILAFQLEAFSDLTLCGIDGISPEAYAVYHRLEEESFRGNLIANVFSGATLNTERCFLSGSYYLEDYNSGSYSNVWYLRSQGYATVGSHPHLSEFFSRKGVNKGLGFEDYWFYDGHYEDVMFWEGWYPDFALFPEILSQYRDLVSQGRKVFSFNVTAQGHGPYPTDCFLYDPVYWPGEGYSDESRYILNNYLGSIRDTQEQLAAFIDQLREDPEPVVVLLYGDHKPWLGDNASVLRELEVNIDSSTEEGFLNYYSTRYLIWANPAARELLGGDFAGEGPDVSAGFLMNLLFEKLGWEGSAFTQFGDSIRRILPVVTSNGYYYEGGRLTEELSPEGRQAFQDLDCVTYYVNRNYDNPVLNGADRG